MLVSMHVATGAAAGAMLGSRTRAVLAGPLLHLAEDAVPHEDIPSLRFEFATGLAGLALVALVRGPFSAEALGAAACAFPDVEHGIRLPRPRGRLLFPSHRWRPWHQAGGISARAQLVLAGLLLGWVAGNGIYGAVGSGRSSSVPPAAT